MNKLIIALSLIIVGFAIAQYTPPDSGIKVTDNVDTIVFTNGWSIQCTSTNIQFIAP